MMFRPCCETASTLKRCSQRFLGLLSTDLYRDEEPSNEPLVPVEDPPEDDVQVASPADDGSLVLKAQDPRGDRPAKGLSSGRYYFSQIYGARAKELCEKPAPMVPELSKAGSSTGQSNSIQQDTLSPEQPPLRSNMLGNKIGMEATQSVAELATNAAANASSRVAAPIISASAAVVSTGGAVVSAGFSSQSAGAANEGSQAATKAAAAQEENLVLAKDKNQREVEAHELAKKKDGREAQAHEVDMRKAEDERKSTDLLNRERQLKMQEEQLGQEQKNLKVETENLRKREEELEKRELMQSIEESEVRSREIPASSERRDSHSGPSSNEPSGRQGDEGRGNGMGASGEDQAPPEPTTPPNSTSTAILAPEPGQRHDNGRRHSKRESWRSSYSSTQYSGKIYANCHFSARSGTTSSPSLPT
jgi:hypothetical protein